MAQSFFVNTSTVGVDLNSGNPTALFAVGTHVLGNAGTEFVYVQANTSIVANRMVAYNSGTFTCGMASGGDLITLGGVIAMSQTSISSQAYGWVAIRGVGLTVGCTASCTTPAVGVFLAAAAATGLLSTSVSASGTMAGIAVIDASQSTSSGPGTLVVNMTWPRTYTQLG